MASSGQEYFVESDLDDLEDLLRKEYGAEGEILYLAAQDEIDREGIISKPRIDELKEYLEDEFEEDELEDFIVVTSRGLEMYAAPKIT